MPTIGVGDVWDDIGDTASDFGDIIKGVIDKYGGAAISILSAAFPGLGIASAILSAISVIPGAPDIIAHLAAGHSLKDSIKMTTLGAIGAYRQTPEYASLPPDAKAQVDKAAEEKKQEDKAAGKNTDAQSVEQGRIEAAIKITKNRASLAAIQKKSHAMALSAPSSEMSTGAKIAIGLGIVSAAAAAGLWFYARKHGYTMTQASKQLFARENPFRLNSAVAFRVDLDSSGEEVILRSKKKAVLYRNNREFLHFSPLPYQLAKIRSGHGELLIYTDQILSRR